MNFFESGGRPAPMEIKVPAGSWVCASLFEVDDASPYSHAVGLARGSSVVTGVVWVTVDAASECITWIDDTCCCID